MSTYSVGIFWERGEQEFLDNSYSRHHKWKFDGGIELDASSSPNVVPLPMSEEYAVDPEEAFVAAISSCHMLWFLSIARKKRFVVELYKDWATGTMQKNNEGKMAITKISLKPNIIFSEESQPTPEGLEQLHKESHEKCFIANSVKTNIKIIS